MKAESATGQADDFAALLEGLALRLAADLAIQPPADAAERIQAATPVRKLEAAISYADGERLFHLGRYEESAKAFERVLLVEPGNVHAHVARVNAWYTANQYARAIEAAEQGLGGTAAAKRSQPRARLFGLLALSHYHLLQFDKAIQVDAERLVEFPEHELAVWDLLRRARTMAYAHQRNEAIAMIEKAVEDQKARGNRAGYVEATKVLHEYFAKEDYYIQLWPEYQQRRGDPAYAREVTELTRAGAERAIKLYRQLLDEAEKSPGPAWRTWAHNWGVRGVNPHWLDGEGYPRPLLLEEEEEKNLVRALGAFSWVPDMAWEGYLKLAQLRQRIKKWPEAVEAYRSLLRQQGRVELDRLPDIWDRGQVQRTSVLDTAVLAQFRIADLSRRQLGKAEEAQGVSGAGRAVRRGERPRCAGGRGPPRAGRAAAARKKCDPGLGRQHARPPRLL